jgi:NADH:ubiquinone oxidoreductase subunit 2 (subunit N)
MVEMLIVGSTGIGYAIVGVLQGLKGEYSNMMIWCGYAFAQIGLFLNLK